MKRNSISLFLAGVLALAPVIVVVAAQQSSDPVTKVKVGEEAPDFELPDQNGQRFKLSDYRGKKSVVLAFYVLAFTGG